jgi:murein DD-endopeptidase MepM/ murein hydrolase activator NlpD
MKRAIITYFAVACAALFLIILFSVLSPALGQTIGGATSTPDDLQRAIEEKARMLDEVNKRIKDTAANIEGTKAQARSIQSDVKRLSGNISQLDLQIKAGELTIDKLTLEVAGLNTNIDLVRATIAEKRNAIAEALRTIQQSDNQALLLIMLRNPSLADSMLEAQSLSNVNSALNQSVGELHTLENTLDQHLAETSEKKVAIETEHTNTLNRKGLVEDQKIERENILKLTKDQQQKYETQLTTLQKQQQAVSDDIDQLEADLRRRLNVSNLPDKRPGVFTMPVAGKITQLYGELSNLYGGKPHNGLDIGAPLGTPIYAARDGMVVAVGDNGRLQYGRYVLIEHDNGLSTLYGHMSRQATVQGKTVKRGELIGYVGATGYAFGNHLHLGLYYCGTAGWSRTNTDSDCYLNPSFKGAGLVPIGPTLNIMDYM